MTSSWRLIISEPNTGAWNMALDEALLKSAGEKFVLPTLRLFNWDPAALSLGFAQPHSDVNASKLEFKGWSLVRRPTGGRAILHIDELTYSVTAPLDDPILNGSLLESYRTISHALLEALARMGVNAVGDKEYPNGNGKSAPTPVCFETPSNYEITAGGKKLIGSAQARKYGGLLQHGSLPLCGDLTRITQVLNYENEHFRQLDADQLLDHAVTLEMVLGNVIPWNTATDAFIEGFSYTFKVDFKPSPPTESELKLAEDLMQTKYGSSAWTARI